jgi:hypothetical protein
MPTLSYCRHGDALIGLLTTGPYHQGNRPTLFICAEDVYSNAAGEMHHELVLGSINPATSPIPAKAKYSLNNQKSHLPVKLINAVNIPRYAEELNVTYFRLLPPDAARNLNAVAGRLQEVFQLLSYGSGPF